MNTSVDSSSNNIKQSLKKYLSRGFFSGISFLGGGGVAFNVGKLICLGLAIGFGITLPHVTAVLIMIAIVTGIMNARSQWNRMCERDDCMERNQKEIDKLKPEVEALEEQYLKLVAEAQATAEKKEYLKQQKYFARRASDLFSQKIEDLKRFLRSNRRSDQELSAAVNQQLGSVIVSSGSSAITYNQKTSRLVDFIVAAKNFLSPQDVIDYKVIVTALNSQRLKKVNSEDDLPDVSATLHVQKYTTSIDDANTMSPVAEKPGLWARAKAAWRERVWPSVSVGIGSGWAVYMGLFVANKIRLNYFMAKTAFDTTDVIAHVSKTMTAIISIALIVGIVTAALKGVYEHRKNKQAKSLAESASGLNSKKAELTKKINDLSHKIRNRKASINVLEEELNSQWLHTHSEAKAFAETLQVRCDNRQTEGGPFSDQGFIVRQSSPPLSPREVRDGHVSLSVAEYQALMQQAQGTAPAAAHEMSADAEEANAEDANVHDLNAVRGPVMPGRQVNLAQQRIGNRLTQ